MKNYGKIYSVSSMLQILKKQENTDMTKEEFIAMMIEEHLADEAAKRLSRAKVARVPTEDLWFVVNFQEIDQSLFQKKRKDESQEETRKLILEAFAEVKRNPKKYGKRFKTMMPSFKRMRNEKRTVFNMKYEAEHYFGTRNADWVEQALEWAQRIFNGESWETICNNPDTAALCRMVVWKDGYARRVGGAHDFRGGVNANPPSYVDWWGHECNDELLFTVPLVVLYEE